MTRLQDFDPPPPPHSFVEALFLFAPNTLYHLQATSQNCKINPPPPPPPPPALTPPKLIPSVPCFLSAIQAVLEGFVFGWLHEARFRTREERFAVDPRKRIVIDPRKRFNQQHSTTRDIQAGSKSATKSTQENRNRSIAPA